MLPYKPMIERMARAVENDGEGLGKYVANEVKLQLLCKVNEDTRAMLTPCLRRLERAVEHACPVVMQMTKEGMQAHYGLTLEPDEVFVAVANRTTVVAFALQLTDVDYPTYQLFRRRRSGTALVRLSTTPSTIWTSTLGASTLTC
jgi:hypothetical protein